jgi:Transposase DDE domain
VLADAGYASEDNFIRGEQQRLRLLVPLRKDPNLHPQAAATTARHNYAARHGARRPTDASPPRQSRLQTARPTVEPVVGQIKSCQRLTMRSRQGIAACSSEWLLVAAAHNLRKLHVNRLSR